MFVIPDSGVFRCDRLPVHEVVVLIEAIRHRSSTRRLLIDVADHTRVW